MHGIFSFGVSYKQLLNEMTDFFNFLGIKDVSYVSPHQI